MEWILKYYLCVVENSNSLNGVYLTLPQYDQQIVVFLQLEVREKMRD